MRKIHLFLPLIILFFFNVEIKAIALDSLLNSGNDSLSISKTEIRDTIAKSISIIAVGDIMLGTNFPSDHYLPPQKKCNPLLEPASPILKDADIIFGNLEGCFLDEGSLVKRCKDTTKCYAFRMPVAFSNCLDDAGFNMLSIANNHIRDFGDKGVDTTLFYLNKYGIKNAGLEDKPYDTIMVQGVKVGLLAFSPFKKTADMNNFELVKNLVQHLDTVCDIVMVSFHGGAEGKDHMNITRESEFFYGEDRGNVWEFAHLVIDAGADLVIGHGPHVPRAIEIYQDRLICYSLGNFCTYARFNLDYPNSLAPIISVELDREGKAISGQIISMLQKGEGGPVADVNKKSLKLIKKLTVEDFPENKIHFQEDGTLMFLEN